jgi:hypothetical protein
MDPYLRERPTPTYMIIYTPLSRSASSDADMRTSVAYPPGSGQWSGEKAGNGCASRTCDPPISPTWNLLAATSPSEPVVSIMALVVIEENQRAN